MGDTDVKRITITKMTGDEGMDEPFDDAPVEEVFQAGISGVGGPVRLPIRCQRILNSSTAGLFSTAFNQAIERCDAANGDAEGLSSWFQLSCCSIMDVVAPLKTTRMKAKPEPWFGIETRAPRQICHRAARKWKKDRLQVSLQILKDSWRNYQRIVEGARREYLSNVIVANRQNQRVLFETIGAVLDPPQSNWLDASPELCENFLHFLND